MRSCPASVPMPSYSPLRWRRNKDHHKAFHKKLVYSLSDSRIPSFAQLRYLFSVVSPWQKRLVMALMVLIVANTGFLSWRYYESITNEVAKGGGGYTEGLVGAPQYINPILLQNNDTDRDLSRFIYSGLMKYDQEAKIVPDLAEKYELSADQKTYTFTLRKDVKWHDGEPFNADDVLFTITKIQDPIIRSPLYISFKDVKVLKKDDYTIQFILPKPFAPFIDLSTIGIIPRHIWQDVSAEYFGLSGVNLKPVGTGMWKYKSLQRESDGTLRSYTMARNDDYYSGVPYLGKLVFKFYPDTDSVIQALKNRNVDGISFLPRELRDRLQKDTDLKYYTFNVPQNTAIFFNQSKNADLRSKAVRQALALTVDKDKIVRDVLAGEGRVIHAPILPGFFGYHEGVKQYSLDEERAKGLLEAAGWKRDANGWYKEEKSQKTSTEGSSKKAGKPSTETVVERHSLVITLVTVNQPESAQAAEVVKEGWVKFGVGATVELVDSARIKSETIDTRDYDALLYGEIVGADPDLYPFWHSSQARAPGLNLAVFANGDADKLLEQGRQTSDENKRGEFYRKFQDILAEEVPAIFLYNPSYNYVVASKIKGIATAKQIVYPSDRFTDISEWYEKTMRTWKSQ